MTADHPDIPFPRFGDVAHVGHIELLTPKPDDSLAFFTNVVNGGMGSLVGNANLIKKVYFPREVLVAATVLSWDVTFLTEMGVLTWRFEVPPAGAAEVLLGLRVELARGVEMVGWRE